MEEPKTILESFTRIRTSKVLGSTTGFMIAEEAMQQRRPDAVGCICGIVGGHGGDVYWVAHEGAHGMVPYGWMDFDLEPASDPKCEECKGGGIDFPTSSRTGVGTVCAHCHGTGSAPPRYRPTALEHVQNDDVIEEGGHGNA